MRIIMPEKVKKIIAVIEAAGYEAYAVGGCVRDSVLERIPDDWDITTSARPEQVKELFSYTIDTGIKHGTVTVMMERTGFEVTTYRIDGEYEDSRHPKDVTFTGNLTEDLKRRDFTMNAMAYNDTKGLVDIFGGMEDIRTGVIRCVGDPSQRFGEDALRMMRAVRFSAQLGYKIVSDTREAMRSLAPALQNISPERIQTELVKLLMSPHPEYLRIAYETGITKQILPEFDRCMETEQDNPHHLYSVGEHTLHALQAIRPERTLRLAMLLHDIGKPVTRSTGADGIHHFYSHQEKGAEIAHNILLRLRFDNETIHKVTDLVKYHDYDIMPRPVSVRRAINKIGEALIPLLFEVKAADIQAQSDYRRKEKEKKLNAVKGIYQEIIKAGECISLKTLAVSGKDLIAAGMKPGAELGQTLNQLLELVLEHPEYNTKEYLLQEVLARQNNN